MTSVQTEQWAIVTGASSGIGEEFARQLARAGYHVLLVARREDRLKAIAEELMRSESVQVEFQSIDLSVAGNSRKLIESLPDARCYAVLINNAGLGKFAEFKNTTWEEQRRMIDLNVLALVELAHAFVRRSLRFGHRSKILNVGSIGAYSPIGYFATYTASKAFVRFFSLALRHELRPHGIGVTLLNPGGTMTEFTRVAGQKVKPSGNLAMMSAEKCVRIAMKALMRDRAVVVPGVINVLSSLFSRMLPDAFSASIGTRAMLMAVDPEESRRD